MGAEQAGHRVLVGLEISDEASYARYRAGMTPILARYGGGFVYDFVVAEVLRGEPGLNRVFMIAFADRRARERFFADPEYLEVRAQHFEPAVTKIELLAEFDVVADSP